MDALKPGEVELKVHGVSWDDHGRVPARVFANKLKQLVSVLEAADTLANGKLVHTYVLASMHMSQPTAVLAEVPLDDVEGVRDSAIPMFNNAIEILKTESKRSERFEPIFKKVGLLTSGVDQKFGFAEVRTLDASVIRIDSFLRQRAMAARRVEPDHWFSGAVMGSFDGILDYVDARGQVPQIKITLSAGGKEIDCVCRREDIEALGDALTKRVRIFGRAIYEGHSPLPVRVEVQPNAIELVAAPGDFSRWRGAFRPFEIESWDLDS